MTDKDRTAINDAAHDPRVSLVPSLTIGTDREMFRRSALNKDGLATTAGFFSDRNAIALYELHRAILGVTDDEIRTKLLFAFTAILSRASRRYEWGPKRPLNANNMIYRVAPVYYEWNVFDLYSRKIDAVIRADREILASGTPGTFIYRTGSASDLGHIDSGSIDYAFTDPPFGSNIFYSDMNLFQEAWLGEVTDNTVEAVVRTGRRRRHSEDRYEQILTRAFSEIHRVLKPGRYLSVVFGNSSGRNWDILHRSLQAAGFSNPPVHVAVLDKGQKSVKGQASGIEAVTTVDLVITVRKDRQVPARPIMAAVVNPSELIEDVVASFRGDLPDASYVHAAVLARAITSGMALNGLDLGAVKNALGKVA